MAMLNVFPQQESNKSENGWSIATLIMAGSYTKCTASEPNLPFFRNTFGTVHQQLLFQKQLAARFSNKDLLIYFPFFKIIGTIKILVTITVL